MHFHERQIVSEVRIVPIDLSADLGRLADLLLAMGQPNHVYRTCEQIYPQRLLMSFGASDQLMVELFTRD